MQTVFSDTSAGISSAVFESLRTLVRDLTGIVLSDNHKSMLASRLGGRVRELKLPSVEAYLDYVQKGGAIEQEKFINAVTTNLTAFFRESHHFEYLKDTVVPALVQNKRFKSRKLRIWSSACSTGEEPYSIAITLNEAIRELAYWDCKILATDLDTNALDEGKKGVYPLERFDKIPHEWLYKWFFKGKGNMASHVRAKPELRNIIKFNQLNLIGPWPMKSPFDVIFCRNVLIYFDEATQTRIVNRMADLLDIGGHFFIGHSENLMRLTDRFQLFEKSIYKRVR